MAAEGLRFTDAYANAPVCSPTRFALITGRYQYRFRGALDEPMGAKARGRDDLGLPPGQPTLPSLLQAAGYATALVGKWHLGYRPHFGPLKSGYQQHFGPYGGAIDYFTHKDFIGVHDLYEDDQEIHPIGYVTDLFSDRAVEFIRAQRNTGRPFLLSVHYTAPHWPWTSRDDEPEARRIDGRIYHFDGGSVATYRKMIHHMDEGIGRIIGALAECGMAENTLTMFSSDNGGERYSNTWPFVGQKMDLLEGGIRVPLIAHWPGVIPPGRMTAQVAMSMDWAPTCLAAAGVAADPEHPLDGIDLMAVLQRPSATIERDVFWRMKFRGQRAIRSGNWKLYSQDGNTFLYDLAMDARERANLAKLQPERAAELSFRYDAWARTMPPIPPDAYVGLVANRSDMAVPSFSIGP
jgi:arylsulfatase A-like enzyme